MKRKIEIKDLEKTLKENISKKPTVNSTLEETIDVSIFNNKDKLYVNKDQDVFDVPDIPDEAMCTLNNLLEKPKSKITDDLIKKYPNIKEDSDRIISTIDKNILEDNKECRINADKDISDCVKKLLINTNYKSVDSPKHYNLYDTEVVKMMELIFGPEKTANWAQLNAFKYRMRMGLKPRTTMEEDFKKEQKCLKIYNELKKKLK